MTTEIFFFKYHAENEAGIIVPDLFLFFRKALYEAKATDCSLISITFDSPQFGKQLKQDI